MYKQNIVKDKSYEFALDIISLVKNFPRNNEGFILSKQLLRSATSIGANVEEAIAAYTKNDFTYKMSLALKEARETNYWLRLVRDSKIVKTELESYIEASEELRKILTAIVKRSKGDDR